MLLPHDSPPTLINSNDKRSNKLRHGRTCRRIARCCPLRCWCCCYRYISCCCCAGSARLHLQFGDRFFVFCQRRKKKEKKERSDELISATVTLSTSPMFQLMIKMCWQPLFLLLQPIEYIINFFSAIKFVPCTDRRSAVNGCYRNL